MSIEIAVLILFLALSAFFSGSELAFFTLSNAKVRSLLVQKYPNARLVEKIKKEPEKLLITILIGNTLVITGSGSIATVLAEDSFGGFGPAIATGIMTALLLFFGEIIPKTLGQRFSPQWALRVAPVLRAAMWLLAPIVWVLHLLTTGFQKMFRLKDSSLVEPEDEVRALMSIGHEAGDIERDEKEMVERVFLLNDITADDVMTPEEYFVGFDTNTPLEKALTVITESGYSRYPVRSPNSDSVEGVVYVKDILSFITNQEMKEGSEDNSYF